MKNSSESYRRGLRILIFAALQWAVVAAALAADAGQPSGQAPTAGSPPSGGSAIPGCTTYKQCIALGQQRLDEKKPDQAAALFKQAIPLSGGDVDRLAEAYARLGVAEAGAGDKIAALAYLERARATTTEKGGWIDAEYKRLLSAQTTLSAPEIQRKLALDQEIARNEPPMRMAADEPEERSEPGADDPRYTANMGVTRGIGLDLATAEDSQKYAPKPAAPKKRPVAAPKPKPKPKPHAAGTGADDRYSREPSLDLRINFEFNSAVLTPDGEQQARELGKALQEILGRDRQAKFVLLGHTDMIGGEGYNLDLSKSRAQSVKAYLARNFPDLAGVLRAEGRGKRDPLFTTGDEESQKLNRRVEVKQIR